MNLTHLIMFFFGGASPSVTPSATVLVQVDFALSREESVDFESGKTVQVDLEL